MPERQEDVAGGTGLLGGTFDPIHVGHIEIARAVQEHYGLERVVLIPAYQNPLREQSAITGSPLNRLIMSVLATLDVPEFFVDAIEIERGFQVPGPSYTIDTLKYFNAIFPGSRLVLIVGGDNVMFEAWKDIDVFPDYISRLAVVSRPGIEFNAGSVPDRIAEITDFLPICESPVSSTEIRRLLLSGSDIGGLVHPEVELFIRKNCLYINKENTAGDRDRF